MKQQKAILLELTSDGLTSCWLMCVLSCADSEIDGITLLLLVDFVFKDCVSGAGLIKQNH